MKKLTIIFTLIVNAIFLNSQSKEFIIADATSKSIIPFCTIKSVNQEQLSYSDENGKATLTGKNSDSILFEHTSYNDLKMMLREIQDTIFLSKKIIQIRTIAIKPSKKEIKLGNFKHNKGSTFHHYENTELLRKIDLTDINGEYKVNQILIPLEFNEDYDSCYCKVHLYKANQNEYPSEDILTKPLIIDKHNLPKKYLIDVKDQNLYLTEKILYVGLECFLLNQVRDRAQLDKINSYKTYTKRFNASPIKLYFNFKEGKEDEINNLSFSRKFKSKRLNPTYFSAGLVIMTYD